MLLQTNEINSIFYDIISVKTIQNFKNSIKGGIFMNISFSPKHQMGSINLNYPSNAKTFVNNRNSQKQDLINRGNKITCFKGNSGKNNVLKNLMEQKSNLMEMKNSIMERGLKKIMIL